MKFACRTCGRAYFVSAFRTRKDVGLCDTCDREVQSERLARKHGITLDELVWLRKKARGRCMICRLREDRSPRTFHIDHDHRTGRVRGILCPRCNSSLSRFDDPDWRGKARAYLYDAHRREWPSFHPPPEVVEILP